MDRDRARYDKEVGAQYRQWYTRFDIAETAEAPVIPAAQRPIVRDTAAVVAAGEARWSGPQAFMVAQTSLLGIEFPTFAEAPKPITAFDAQAHRMNGSAPARRQA